MSDGERALNQQQHQQPQNHNTGGGGGGGGSDGLSSLTNAAQSNCGMTRSVPMHDMTGSITESTSATNLSSGNGCLASSSSSAMSSSFSSCSVTATNSSAMTKTSSSNSLNNISSTSSNIKLSTSSSTLCHTSIQVTEEPCNGDSASSTLSRNDENAAAIFSDSSVETFHTPSASLQNLSNTSHFGSSRFNSTSNGSSNRRTTSEGSESKLLEEEEILTTTNSGAASLSVIAATDNNSQQENKNPSPVTSNDKVKSISEDKDCGQGTVGELTAQPSPNSSSNSESSNHTQNQQKQPNQKKKHKRKSSQQQQQHKRQGSVGSQCSVSSNPENSQFKTADAHSSDSDASRNYGTTREFPFDEAGTGSANGGASPTSAAASPGSSGFGARSDEGFVIGKEDPDRKSLQSENSHSGGELLNTSVESVDFGPSSGEPLSYLSGRGSRDDGEIGHHNLTRYSSTRIGSISPPLSTTSSQLHSSGSKPRMKKKVWYQQIFSTSYKTRVGDFKKIFKELPAKERLIVDYSCALQKEILLQGRMYISQNYVSFYANIFGWETQLSISFKEIESITKEKTALIIPNAIQISTLSEKFFFSSFVTRDTTYVMLFKLWQSALLEDNMSKKELWKLVHTCYGEELGVTSEDESEDMFSVGGPPIIPTSSSVHSTIITTSIVDGTVKTIAIAPTSDGPDEEEVSTGEIGPAIAVGLNIGSSIVTSNGIPISSDQLLVKDANVVPVSVPVLPMDPSDSSDAEAALESELSRKDLSAIVVPFLPIKEVIPECPVDHTKGKEMMNTLIPCNIDQLFTMLFTNSTFYLEFQTKRKTSDINQSDWQIGGDESQKTRQLTFTVVTGQTIGPSKAQVTETQTLLPASKPGLLYAIQSESVNAGIPYADCFAVNCHYCLTRLSDKESNMVVISKIHYKKSTWAKTFIEKNSMSALADYFKGLETALKEECAKINAGGITPTSPIVVSNLPRRRHPRKKCRAPDIPATAMNRPNLIESSMMHQGKRSTLPPNVSEAMTEASMDTGESSTVMKVILTVLGFLVLLNAFLYFKLSSLETAANLSVLYPPTIQFSGEAPQTHQEWLMLLQQQESLHRTEVHSWHEVLISAIKILHQAERDLESLKALITTYGRGDVSIVTTPSPISASGVVDSGGPLHKSKGVEGSYKANVDNEGDDPSNNFETNEDDMFSSINKNDGDIERREMKGVEA